MVCRGEKKWKRNRRNLSRKGKFMVMSNDQLSTFLILINGKQCFAFISYTRKAGMEHFYPLLNEFFSCCIFFCNELCFVDWCSRVIILHLDRGDSVLY